MGTEKAEANYFEVGTLRVEVHGSRGAAAEAAARSAVETMQQLKGRDGNFGIIFASGLSQIDILNLLTSQPRLPWSRVNGFHMDE